MGSRQNLTSTQLLPALLCQRLPVVNHVQLDGVCAQWIRVSLADPRHLHRLQCHVRGHLLPASQDFGLVGPPSRLLHHGNPRDNWPDPDGHNHKRADFLRCAGLLLCRLQRDDLHHRCHDCGLFQATTSWSCFRLHFFPVHHHRSGRSQGCGGILRDHFMAMGLWRLHHYFAGCCNASVPPASPQRAQSSQERSSRQGIQREDSRPKHLALLH